MNDLRPAAVSLAAVLLASGVWSIARLFGLQTLMIGIAGGPLLHWTGPFADGEGWALWVVLPLVLGWMVGLTTGLATRTPLARLGLPLLGIAVVGHGLWTLFIGLLGFGAWLDTTFPSSLLFLAYPHESGWEAWGRWVFDGTLLVTLAVLLGFGPNSPSARRAVFVGLILLAIDQAWRITVAVLSGSVPFLMEGLGPLDGVQSLVWCVLGGLGIALAAVVGNLPGADGPPRRGLLIGLAIAGVLFGLEGSLLYGFGLLHVLGVETGVHLPMPAYPGLLACLRLGLLVVGLLAAGLGAWRQPEVHTSTHG